MNLQEKTILKIESWNLKYDGLPKAHENRIAKLVLQYESKQLVLDSRNKILSGATILREYQGKTYKVAVLDNGYLYDNKHYRSLSAIANVITGSHCNGRKFFGVI